MNTPNRRGAIPIRSVHRAYNLPMSRRQVPPPHPNGVGDTWVHGPVYRRHTVASCGFLVASLLPAPRRDRGRAAHPPYFGTYLIPAVTSTSKGKRNKTGPFTPPQPGDTRIPEKTLVLVLFRARRFSLKVPLRGTPNPFLSLEFGKLISQTGGSANHQFVFQIARRWSHHSPSHVRRQISRVHLTREDSSFPDFNFRFCAT